MCRILVTMRDFISTEAFSPVHVIDDGQAFGRLETAPDFAIIEVPGVARNDACCVADPHEFKRMMAERRGEQFNPNSVTTQDTFCDMLSQQQKTQLSSTGKITLPNLDALLGAVVLREPKPIEERTILTREQAIAASGGGS